MAKTTSAKKAPPLKTPKGVTKQFRPPRPEAVPLETTSAGRRAGVLANMFQQIYQNARRADATRVEVTTETGAFTVACDGRGEDDPSNLRTGDTLGALGARNQRLGDALTKSTGGPGMITALRRTQLRVTAVSREPDAPYRLQGWTVEMPPAPAGGRLDECPDAKARKANPADVKLLQDGTGTVTSVRLAGSLGGPTATAGELALAARAAARGFPLPTTINGCGSLNSDYLGNAERVWRSERIPWARIGVYKHEWTDIHVHTQAHHGPDLLQAKIDAVFTSSTGGAANTNIAGVRTRLHLPVVATNDALYHATVDVIDIRKDWSARKTLFEREAPASRDILDELYRESLKGIFDLVAEHGDAVSIDTREEARRLGRGLPEPTDLTLTPWMGAGDGNAHQAGVYDPGGDPVSAEWALIVDLPGIDPGIAEALRAAAKLRQNHEETTIPAARSRLLWRNSGKTILARPCSELAGYAEYDGIPRITGIEILYEDAETGRRRPIRNFRVNHLAWTTRVRHGGGPHRGLPRLPEIVMKITVRETEGANTVETVEHWRTPFAVLPDRGPRSREIGPDEVLLADGAERDLAALGRDEDTDETTTLARYLAGSHAVTLAGTREQACELIERMKLLATQLLGACAEANRGTLEHELQKTTAAYADNRRATEAHIRYDPRNPDADAEPVVAIAYEDD